jgi:hypothetical protein
MFIMAQNMFSVRYELRNKNIEHTIHHCTSNERISMNGINISLSLRIKNTVEKYCGEESEYYTCYLYD